MNFLFDIDGTLTEPVQEISQPVTLALQGLMQAGHGVYLVAGSTFEKVSKQIGLDVMASLSGVFTSSGAEYRASSQVEYSLPKPELSPELKALLDQSLSEWTGPHTATQLEYRPGMLNFCPVGREATLSERKEFIEFDASVRLRERAVSGLRTLGIPGLSAVIGGQVSVDLYFDGFTGKAYAVNYLTQYGLRDFIYFGDKMTEGGNDYPAAAHILAHNLGAAISVRGVADTLSWLARLG